MHSSYPLSTSDETSRFLLCMLILQSSFLFLCHPSMSLCYGIMHLVGLLIAVTQLVAVNNSFWVFKFSSFHLLFFVLLCCLFCLLLWFFCLFCRCCFISFTVCSARLPSACSMVFVNLPRKAIASQVRCGETNLMGNGIRTRTKGL